MSYDIACEELGTVSVSDNHVLWIISKFYELEKNIRFKSPQFNLIDSTWQLRYCCFRSTLNSKEWLDIGIKLLSKSSTLKGHTIRFGIIGNNLEVCKTLESNDFPKYHSLTVPYEDQMSEWVPDGNLCLFFTMKTPEVEAENEDWEELDLVDASTQTEEEIENKHSEEIDEITVVEASTQTEEETEAWKLPEGLQEFLLSGNFYDVVLKVGEEEFKSHSCILAARSPVFSQMMMQQMQEKNTSVVDIHDVSPNTFSIFLRYLYTGKVENITQENAHVLYRMAKEYEVTELEKISLDHMLENISSKNFCDILTVSLLYEETDLIDACSQFFMKNALILVETPEWEMFLRENPVVGNGLYVRLLKMNK